MRLVIQRVNHASVTVKEETVGSIQKGYVVLLGVGEDDTRQMADKYVEKLAKLRIFSDDNDKINLSIQDVGGEMLVISQFTLYADCRKGNRPGFSQAASVDKAQELYEYFLDRCRQVLGSVQHGIFGADMKVELENDGPFTIVWDSRDW